MKFKLFVTSMLLFNFSSYIYSMCPTSSTDLSHPKNPTIFDKQMHSSYYQNARNIHSLSNEELEKDITRCNISSLYAALYHAIDYNNVVLERQLFRVIQHCKHIYADTH